MTLTPGQLKAGLGLCEQIFLGSPARANQSKIFIVNQEDSLTVGKCLGLGLRGLIFIMNK